MCIYIYICVHTDPLNVQCVVGNDCRGEGCVYTYGCRYTFLMCINTLCSDVLKFTLIHMYIYV